MLSFRFSSLNKYQRMVKYLMVKVFLLAYLELKHNKDSFKTFYYTHFLKIFINGFNLFIRKII